MRTIGAVAFLLCALAMLQQPALAQQAGRQACGADKLGVARTVTIDADGGPHLGAQYRKSRLQLAEGEVVLTFDDGPSHANTRSILQTLAAQCTKATFFMVGRMALSDPETVKAVAAQGHSIGTHTWSHARLPDLAEDKAQLEIELGFSAVQQALGKPVSPFFRFPYLRDSAFTLGLLDGRHMATIGIDVDSRDFETRDPVALHDRVIAALAARRKGIILFHDIHAWTARALPLILADLKSLGFRVVHLAAKAGATTVAEYDKVAERELARRRLAIARSPLAKRAVTWPMGSAPGVVAGAKESAKAPKSAADAAPPVAADGKAHAAPDAKLAPAAAPKDDWSSEIWSQTR